MLEKLQELFPEMVEGVQWDLAGGGFRNVLNFLASLRVAVFAKMLDDENLPLTHGVIWNVLGRNYRCFCQQGTEVSILELLDCPTDELLDCQTTGNTRFVQHSDECDDKVTARSRVHQSERRGQR